LNRFGRLDPHAISELKRLPALFCIENEEAPTRVGRLTSIKPKSRSVRIEFEFDNAIEPIRVGLLAKSYIHFELGRFELSTTHWAVKDSDLWAVLTKLGVRLPKARQPFTKARSIMENRIPTPFLQHASSVLAETQHGLSGPEIVEICNAWAVDMNIETPHSVYPFTAYNKRTALFENLRAFEPIVQFKLLSEICDHPRLHANPKVRELRQMLINRFGTVFGSPHEIPVSENAFVPQAASEGQDSQAQVFLCHASADKPKVRELYNWLKGQGFRPWLDEEDLLPGQEWEYEIPRMVRASTIVVVCLSKHSIGKTGYVQKEIKIALDVAEQQPEGAIFIIPARLEDCTVPERLSKYHWVNLFDQDGHIRLARSIGERIQQGSNPR